MDRVNNDYDYIRISPTEMIDSILNEICTLMSPILNGICTLTSPVFNRIYTLMSPILNSIMYIVLCTCIHICISIGQKTDFNTINTVFVDSCCSIISLMCSVCPFVLFLLGIVLYALFRFTPSSYLFGIFKYFTQFYNVKKQHILFQYM